MLRQLQVSVQRLEHVLPWPDSAGAPHQTSLPLAPRAHQVWDQPVFCPIAAADYVAGASARDLHIGIRKKGLPVRRRHDLSARFAAGVRIETPERLRFAVRFV